MSDNLLRNTRALVTAIALSVALYAGIDRAHAAPALPPHATDADAAHQFNFLVGNWKVHNRYLKARMAKSSDWIEFEANDSFHELPGTLGTEENFSTDHWPNFVSIGLHLFDPSAQKWVLYWADSRNSPGIMQTLASGTFSGNVGTFYGADTLDGKPIVVRILWKQIDADHVRWEQAFSNDDRVSWETNWTMDFVRS